MEECRKRQVEKRNGQVLHRCINKEADQYKQYVDGSVCNSCPVRVFMEKKKLKYAKGSGPALPVIHSNEGFPTCEYRINVDGHTCGVTGLPVTREICNRCAKDSKEETPNLLQKVMNYSAAVRKWVAAGRPERTDEEIQAIYDEHCSKCSMYDKERNICNSCGCPANKDQPALRNKLRMGTEACPLGRFPAKVETNA